MPTLNVWHLLCAASVGMFIARIGMLASALSLQCAASDTTMRKSPRMFMQVQHLSNSSHSHLQQLFNSHTVLLLLHPHTCRQQVTHVTQIQTLTMNIMLRLGLSARVYPRKTLGKNCRPAVQLVSAPRLPKASVRPQLTERLCTRKQNVLQHDTKWTDLKKSEVRDNACAMATSTATAFLSLVALSCNKQVGCNAGGCLRYAKS